MSIHGPCFPFSSLNTSLRNIRSLGPSPCDGPGPCPTLETVGIAPKNGLLTLVPWSAGTVEVTFITILMGTFVGIPFLLTSPNVLASTAFVFYIFLLLIGILGHIDKVRAEQIRSVRSESVWKQIGVGIVGFVVLELTFVIQLSVLETTPANNSMTPVQALLFNMSFVICGEELVFRDTLPYYLSQLFSIKINEEAATALAFLLSGIVFGLFHIVAYGYDYIAVLKAIIAGFILSIARMYAGLLASYFAHFLFNITNILSALAIALTFVIH